jgi:hypothetical protein
LNLFKSILDTEKSLPKDQPYKDLVRLVNFILRQFFKALEEESFLAVEVRNPAISITRKLTWCPGILPEESRTLEEILELGTRRESQKNARKQRK